MTAHFSVHTAVKVGLLMLDSYSYGEVFGLHSNVAVFQHIEHISRTVTYGKNHIVGFDGNFSIVFYIAYGFNSAAFGIIAAEFCSEYYLSAKRYNIVSYVLDGFG